MKNLKRLPILVLVAAMLLSCIATAEIEYNGTAPLFDEPVTLTWFATNGASSYYDFDNMSWMQEILRRANVKLDIELVDSSNYKDALLPRIAAGVDLPDVMMLSGFDEDMSFINTGLFLDLTDMIEEKGYNIKKRFEQVPGLKELLTTPDGKIYYMPTIDTLIDVYCISIMANRWWLEKLDAEIPTTTEEFYELCKLMKETDMNGNGEADEVPVYMEQYYLRQFGAMWGIDLNVGFYVDEDGLVKCAYAGEQYKDFVTYWKRMYDEGLLNKDFATATWDTSLNMLANNAMGFYFRHHDNAVTWSTTMDPNFNADTDELLLFAIEPLEGPYGHKNYWAGSPVQNPFVITKDSKHAEEAFAFLDWMFSEEANTLHFFGIEGEDYEIVDGKMVVDLERRNNNDFSYRMGNQFGGLPRVQEPIQRDITRPQGIIDANEMLKEYYRTPIWVSFFLPDEAKIMQDYKADFMTYASEMMVGFITGTVDIDIFDTEYTAALEELKMDEIIEAYQARYDRAHS